MSKQGFILWLYVETPLHAGVGQGIGDIDLPLQRERSTGFPYVQASGIKGAMRAHCAENLEASKVEVLFGPDTQSAHEHAGALSLSDARLLLFPVRSLAGVWAWITCPKVLSRFLSDAKRVGLSLSLPEPPSPLSPGEAIFSQEGAEVVLSANGRGDLVVLEDLAFTRSSLSESFLPQWTEFLAERAFPKEPGYWRENLRKHLVILSDEDFQFFVEHATEVLTRVRIEPETKTVQEGALWTEELLSSESLLYCAGVVEPAHKPQEDGGSASAEDLLKKFRSCLTEHPYLQVGGDRTLGRGWCFAQITAAL